MKIAVIGANGFIGSRLVERSQEDGTFEVVPVVRKHSSLVRASRFVLDARIGDAQDAESLAKAISGCDAVFHCVVGDAKQIVGAAKALPEACAKAGITKVAYMSSASVYGQDVAPGITEDTPLPTKHVIAYNASKAAAERQVIARSRARNIQTAVMRPSIVWGPRSFWIGGFADQLLNGTAGFAEGGRGVCNSIYVDNLIDASLLTLRSKIEPGRSFFVQDELSPNWADFLSPVVEALGIDFASVPSVPRVSAPQKKRLDIDKFRDTPTAKLLKKIAGPKVKSLAKSAVSALTKGDTEIKPFVLPAQARIAVNFEISELHCCRGRLSDERIRSELGYIPRITIEEGMRRSIAWLEFAGYPLHGSSDV